MTFQGTGKTFLSAFDAKKYNPKRLLFIIHRENIARAAMKSYKAVFRGAKTMGVLSGHFKPENVDFIFSTIQTMSRDNTLNAFPEDYFDYIVIDEFHHVAANSYKGIVDYFKPKFLLGLTATPFRMDNKDIFEFCDDNLVYEINLKEAIEREYLVPFKYYGIYDETDYSKINFVLNCIN